MVHILNYNKKSHWLQVSASKLLRDYSGNIKNANDGFFGQHLQVKTGKSEQHH